MKFIDPEIIQNKTLWILLGIGLVLSIIVDLLNNIIKLRRAERKIDNLLDEVANYKKRVRELIEENDQQREQIWILEEEADGVSEFTDKYETIKINPIFKGKRALVGDYMDNSFKNTRKRLRSFGLYVDVVRDGETIINKIKNGYKCDIIFTNNIFQDTTGPSVLSKLKTIKNFNTPVVIHTISRNMRNDFLSMGFDEYLEKPVSIDDLEKVLKKLLGKSKKEKSNSKRKSIVKN